MKKLFLGAAAIALSGCSWLGLGDKQVHHDRSSYGTYAQKKDKCCVGGKSLSRWNAELAGGIEEFVSGDIISGGNENAATLEYGDVYGAATRIEPAVSYALKPNRKVKLSGFYKTASAEDQTVIGTVNDTPITGQFTDYKSYGAELGLRQYFGIKRAPLVKSIRPYVEGNVGIANVDDIDLLGLNDTATPRDVRLYDGGWVPTASGMIGIETPVLNRLTLGLETGLRYQHKLSSNLSLIHI